MARDRKCFLFLALLFGAVVKATFRLLGGRRESVFFCWHRAGRRALESGKCKKHTNCLPILSFLCNFGRQNILKSRFMLKSIQHFAYIAALMAALALLASCTGGKKRYVIGVSQCSEDVWREKLNQELRVAALYYNNMDLDIASANDDVRRRRIRSTALWTRGSICSSWRQDRSRSLPPSTVPMRREYL